jgi:hypothetical protein
MSGRARYEIDNEPIRHSDLERYRQTLPGTSQLALPACSYPSNEFTQDILSQSSVILPSACDWHLLVSALSRITLDNPGLTSNQGAVSLKIRLMRRV